MQADPRYVPHQEVAPKPGDLVALHLRRDLGKLCLVITAEAGIGLADRPAWHCLLLTSRLELVKLMIHVETRGSTWHLVNVDEEVE